jgi:4-hydroxy-tetrahydrodipicolinate reductase
MADGGRAIRVAVAGAAGRMGATVCDAVRGADDMELVAAADPGLAVSVTEALADGRPDVLVDFTIPSTVVANAHEAVDAGVHVVIGTTGFAPDAFDDLRGAAANVFVAPNFAIGAVLMMQFAATAAKHMRAAEIIELHHDGKLDRPSGTAARTAALMRDAAAEGSGSGSGAGAAEVPIHSVRLPGLVAHQEVIFGDVGQTLTIRHDSVDRVSFMPGVLLAVRRVGSLPESPMFGLEHLL